MNKQIIAFIFTALVLAGCGTVDQSPDQTPEPQDETTQEVTLQTAEPIEVVTSFYPLAYMAEGIIGENGTVVNLVGNGDVHDYTPSPRDMVKLQNADLVVVQGADLEPWAEDVVSELAQNGVTVLEVAEMLELMKAEDEHHDEHGDEDHEVDQDEDTHEDEAHEDDHPEEEEDHHEDEHGHNHGEFDPHTWLDPVLAQQMIDEMTESIVAVDKSNTETYEKNAEELKAKFKELDTKYTTQLAQCNISEVIVSHNAYGYLAARYGFETHAIAGLSTNDEPSAKILAELKEEAEEGITHILVEENSVQKFAQTLASETGLEVLPINPLGQGTQDEKKDFIDVMNDNLESFVTGLGCQ